MVEVLLDQFSGITISSCRTSGSLVFFRPDGEAFAAEVSIRTVPFGSGVYSILIVPPITWSSQKYAPVDGAQTADVSGRLMRRFSV